MGYIGPSPRPKSIIKVDATDSPIANSLKSRGSDQKARIDLEPYWEEDPRQVVFRARVDGVTKCTFSPIRLILNVADLCRNRYNTDVGTSDFIPCKCRLLSVEFPVPPA